MEGETLFEPFTLIGCDRAQPSKICETCFQCVTSISNTNIAVDLFMNNKYFCEKCGVLGESTSVLSEIHCPVCSQPMLMDNNKKALANDSSVSVPPSSAISPFGFCDLFSIPAGSDFADYEYLLNNVIMAKLSFDAVNSEKYKELMELCP